MSSLKSKDSYFLISEGFWLTKPLLKIYHNKQLKHGISIDNKYWPKPNVELRRCVFVFVL